MDREEILAALADDRNCAQCVLGAFADETGYDAEETDAFAVHFGGGMHMGRTCGCITGGLMAMGLLETDVEKAVEFENRFKERFGSCICYELLGNTHPRQARDSGKTLEVCPGYIAGAIGMVKELTEG